MSDEEKKESSETPGQQETAPQAEKPEDVRQEAAEPEKAEKAEKTEKAEKAEKGKKESHKKEKEKTYTLTREQMEAAELAAKQLAAVKEQFVRLTAEYDNYRKRTAREKDTIYQDAKADTIEAFLAVYDNLERAGGNSLCLKLSVSILAPPTAAWQSWRAARPSSSPTPRATAPHRPSWRSPRPASAWWARWQSARPSPTPTAPSLPSSARWAATTR
jgi:chemotaxis protein histidine kinase CheA